MSRSRVLTGLLLGAPIALVLVAGVTIMQLAQPSALTGQAGEGCTPTVQEFEIPSSDTYFPVDIAVDPDGNAWFTQQRKQSTETDGGNIVRVTPDGTFTQFSLPTEGITPQDITVGPDGNLWFTETLMQGAVSFDGQMHGKIGKVTPNGTITDTYDQIVTEPFQAISSISQDGSLAFTFGDVVEVTGMYGGVGSAGAGSLLQKVASDGNVLFTDVNGRHQGHLQLPNLMQSFPSTVPTWGIARGYGTWISEPTNNLLRYSKMPGGQGGAIGIPTPNSYPTDVAVGPDYNVWFVEQVGNKIGMVNLDEGNLVEEFDVPTLNSEATNIAVGADGTVWFTENSGGKIGKITNCFHPSAYDDSIQILMNSSQVPMNVLRNDTAPNGATLIWSGWPINGAVLSVTGYTNPSHGTLSGMKYTPANGYVGRDSFTYTISDGLGWTSSATMYITVLPRNGTSSTSGGASSGQNSSAAGGVSSAQSSGASSGASSVASSGASSGASSVASSRASSGASSSGGSSSGASSNRSSVRSSAGSSAAGNGGDICDTICGDGIVVGPDDGGDEQCDDHNTQNDDGCSSTCDIECTTDSDCPTEDCEDGICTDPVCGNGDVETPPEQCDDGNTQSGDGCSNNCKIETHSACTGINQCTQVSGPGRNECDAPSDCCDPNSPSCVHDECSGQNNATCGPVSGPGKPLCPNSAACVNTHLECVGLSCAIVSGPGPNLHGCTVNNAACGTVTHSACTGINQCTQVSGPGRNECDAPSDCCDPNSPSCVHDECSGQNNATCGPVSGPGKPLCPNSAACVNTHLECVGLSCAIVSGPGPNLHGCTVNNAACPIGGPRCGDGSRNQPSEECDDGNTRDGDGCSSTCIIDICPLLDVKRGAQCSAGDRCNVVQVNGECRQIPVGCAAGFVPTPINVCGIVACSGTCYRCNPAP